MKNKTQPDTVYDDEDDEYPCDDGGDVDWYELTNLYMQLYDEDDDDPDFALLGSYARDSRCERHETRHRRY